MFAVHVDLMDLVAIGVGVAVVISYVVAVLVFDWRNRR